MDNTENIKERMREMDPKYKLNKVINNLSTGGKVERRYKKRIGNKVNKDLDKKFDKMQSYNIVDKIKKRIQDVYEINK
jgi:hypothetical protein